MTPRCRRHQLTPELFAARRELYWKLPRHLGDPDDEISLARLWKEGGHGVTSILPALGLRVHHPLCSGQGWIESLEEMAVFAGIDADSIATTAIKSLGLATPSKRMLYGRRVTHWHNINPRLAAVRKATDDFKFSAMIIYGGHWRMMTAPQKLIYMALATTATRYRHAVESLPMLTDRIRMDGQLTEDLRASRGESHTAAIRIAQSSVAELQRRTGLSRNAVNCAISAWKHPALRPGSNDIYPDEFTQYAPIYVYPSRNGYGAHVFAFRDHIEHWPWDLANAGRRQLVARTRLLIETTYSPGPGEDWCCAATDNWTDDQPF